MELIRVESWWSGPVHNKTVSPPAAPWECAGAFGFFNAAGEYEQVVLEAGGMGNASTWGRSSDGVFAERGSATVEWGIERRNIEIVRRRGTRVVWKFSGDVWEGLEGELAPAEGRRQKVVLRRPKDLRAMLELGGLPDAPVPPSTPSEARIVRDTDWPPVRTSKK